jgi:hypothetical protein
MESRSLDFTPLLAVAGGPARSELDSAISASAASRDKLDDMDSETKQIEGDSQRLAEIRSREIIESILTDSPPPSKPRRDNKMRAMHERKEGLKAARAVQLQRIDEAKEREAEARRQLADQFLPTLATLRLTALDNCRAPLGELYRRLAEAAVVDLLQDRLVGRDFTVPPGFDVSGLFRGGMLLTKMQAGISPQLRQLLPADLNDIEKHVESLAAEILSQLDAAATQSTVRN